MAHWILVTITTASVVSGFMSAAAWLYASTVKISREEAVDQRKKEALRKGETPNLGVPPSMDGTCRPHFLLNPNGIHAAPPWRLAL
jgi:hypothetical protein